MAQTRIPGTGGKKFPALTKKAKAYKAAARKFAAASTEKEDAKATLIAAMKERKLTEYIDRDENPPIEVIVEEKVNVRVIELKEDEA